MCRYAPGNIKGKTEEHSNTAGTLERAKIAMEQKERTVDDIRKDLEREGLGGDQHLVWGCTSCSIQMTHSA